MTGMGNRYFMIHKPYDMVSQFVSPDKVRLLTDLDFDFPEGTHAIGRLDGHSEGLLLLTTNKKVTRLLFEGTVSHKRTYLVQVRNVMTAESLEQLRTGVPIIVAEGKTYFAVPEDVAFAAKPPGLGVLKEGYREDIPHTWLQITLTEGKFHQVRKMVGAIGHPCKRLIRISIEQMELGDLLPGAVKEMEEADFFRQLNISDY